VGDEDDRSLELGEGVLQRLSALDVEVVGGLVEDQDVGPRGDQDRQRETALLAAGDVAQLLLGVGAGEEEAAEQHPRLLAAEAGLALRRVEHGARPRRRVGVLGEVAELDVVAAADDAGGGGATAGESLDQGRLAGPVGADEDHVLAALDLEAGAGEEGAARNLDRGVDHLQHHPAGSLRRLEGEAQVAAVAALGHRAVALGLLDLLDPRLRLPRLRRLVAEALDEALHPLDLGLLALDRLAEGDLTRRLLLAPSVPGPSEEAGALRLQLQHRGPNRLQEPAVVGDEDDRGVEVDEVGLEPLQRGDVEVVGRLVEQQQVGLGRQRPRQRGSRQLAAGERRERPLGLLGVEAEPAQNGQHLVAPAVAAAGFESLLRGRIGAHRLLVGATPLRHLPLQPLQLHLGLQHVGAAGEDVFAECGARFTRRPLVVQGHPGPPLHRQRARVRRVLAGEDPQQRRLAGPVAAGQGHPLPRLELEGDVGEQQLAADVDVE